MLTQEQIDFFHENGYLIMRGIINGRELDLLRQAVDEVQEQGIQKQGSDHLYQTLPDGRKVYWRSENIWQRGDIFQAVTVHPDLLENIAQCIGHSFYPWNDSLVVKLANQGAPVKWHQDPPYGDRARETVFPIPNFTTDIYLDHSGPDNGCVYAIPGRHLVGHVDISGVSEEDLFEKHGAVPLEMEEGDVLFHCLSTPHGSRMNTSSAQRRIFYIHYLNEEVYRDAYGKYEWSKQKPGWGDSKRVQIESMLEKRGKLGFELPSNRNTLRLGEGGYEFVAVPKTPPRYWESLNANASADELNRKKQLGSPNDSANSNKETKE